FILEGVLGQAHRLFQIVPGQPSDFRVRAAFFHDFILPFSCSKWCGAKPAIGNISRARWKKSCAIIMVDVPILPNCGGARSEENMVDASLHRFGRFARSEEHTSELQSREKLVCR